MLVHYLRLAVPVIPVINRKCKTTQNEATDLGYISDFTRLQNAIIKAFLSLLLKQGSLLLFPGISVAQGAELQTIDYYITLGKD
jgi:hypothetical protein